MDQLPTLGTAISQIVLPTYKIFTGLLEQQASTIRATPCKEFTYGSDPRQKLDVYYPSSKPTGAGCPILVYLYGGGLINGAKRLPMVGNGLAYANVGNFFAEKYGFVVVVVDYRLVPQARFPSGGEDLALAVEWIRKNPEAFGSSDGTRNIFLMGNSAGGVHVSTYLFSPAFAESRSRVLSQAGDASLRLRGAIFVAVPFHFGAADAGRADVLTKYYGERVSEDCPLGLVTAVKQKSSVAESLPGVRFLTLTGTLDPENEILLPNRDFVSLWNADGSSDKSDLQVEVMDAHNHISPVLALSTADQKAEAWGHVVAEFCNSTVN